MADNQSFTTSGIEFTEEERQELLSTARLYVKIADQLKELHSLYQGKDIEHDFHGLFARKHKIENDLMRVCEEKMETLTQRIKELEEELEQAHE